MKWIFSHTNNSTMRQNSISKLVLTLALAGLWGCQDGDRLTAPDLGTPSLSVEGSADWSIVAEAGARTAGAVAVIDGKGGQLLLGNHRLVVPAGAVDAPTVFTMKRGSDQLRVTLTASRETHNDVGAAGFAVPLTLSLSYREARDLPSDLSSLKIVWIRPDGVYEPQPTTLDTDAHRVHGEIDHFSDYAMASS